MDAPLPLLRATQEHGTLMADNIETSKGRARRAGDSVFYGWVIVAVAALAEFLVSGVLFAFSVFIVPMTQDMGWTRATVATAHGLCIAIGCLLATVAGHLSDRIGPRKVVFAGGIAYVLGFLLASRVSYAWQFYLAYGVLTGIGFGCTYVPLGSTIVKWFVAKRGLATGIYYAGGGIGGLILTPLVQTVITNHGWRTGWLALAVGAAVAILPGALFLRKSPSVMGLQPLGATAHPVAGDGPKPQDTRQSDRAESGWTFKEAMASSSLWLFNLGTLLVFFSITLAQLNLVPYATDKGISAAAAAAAMGVLAGSNAAGRLGIGPVVDRVGTRIGLLVATCLLAAVMFYLITIDSITTLLIFAIPFGFLGGAFTTMSPLALSHMFGTRAMGAILGVGAVFSGIGPAFGPAVGAAIYDVSGSYLYAFILAGLAVIIALPLFRSVVPRRTKEAAGASRVAMRN